MKKGGLLLDISLGGTPQPRSVTFSPRGDLKRSPLTLPFPLKTASVHTAVVTHVLEFLDPTTIFAWFDELHRVMQPQGIVYLSGPYGGDLSHGWISDPMHRTRITEQTFAWLDPRLPFYALHADRGRPHPLPWMIQTVSRVPGPHATVGYNVTMTQVPATRRKAAR